MFRQVRLADFEQQPKRPHVEAAAEVPQTVFPHGNLVATEPLRALVLPPKPAVLAELAADSGAIGSDLDPETGWAMVSGPGGVRLWPARGNNMQITPIVFESDSKMIPVFVNPQQGSNQPEIVLIGAESGDILHYKRISFALNEQPASSSLGLASNDRVTHAIASGANVICATLQGNLYVVRLRNGFGSVTKPVVVRISQSWFSWGVSPIVDLSASGTFVACLRKSGQVAVYSVEDTVVQILDFNLSSLKLPGNYLNLALDHETIYVVVQSDSTTYKLARIVSGVLEQQHALPRVKSTSASVSVSGNTKYVLFDRQLVVLESASSETVEIDADMTVNSLIKTAKSLNLEAPKSASLYFKDTVPIFGSKAFRDGIMLLTSVGVVEIDAPIGISSLPSLLEQAVFHQTAQSPLTFVPAIKMAIGSDGYLLANKAVISLCSEIVTSVKVPPVPNIEAHLDLRINWIRTLVQFSLEALVLNDESRVYLQNSFEQLHTARSLVDLAGTVGTCSSREWLLYHTDQITMLLEAAPLDRVINALFLALKAGSPSLLSPGIQGYWLAQPEILALLKGGKTTPEYAELASTILAYASGSGNISASRAQQQQNVLLKELAGRGYVEQAIEIAHKLDLWAPLAALTCDQWLNGSLEFEVVRSSIQEHGYEFARVMFDHLKSIGQAALITTKLWPVFPEFVYGYFESEPNVQWALADLQGNQQVATQVLLRACQKETDGRRKAMLASLLRLQAVASRDFASGNEASKIIAEESASTQAARALRTPSSQGFAAVVADTSDLVVKLALLPADANNYINAINLLPWVGASDAQKRLLAQQIVVNTDWDNISESSLIYKVLWSSLIDNNGVQQLEPQLFGDLQVSTEDVSQIAPQRLRVKLAGDIAATNLKVKQLPDVGQWIRGAIDRTSQL